MIKLIRENRMLIKCIVGPSFSKSKLLREARIVAIASGDESENEV